MVFAFNFKTIIEFEIQVKSKRKKKKNNTDFQPWRKVVWDPQLCSTAVLPPAEVLDVVFKGQRRILSALCRAMDELGHKKSNKYSCKTVMSFPCSLSRILQHLSRMDAAMTLPSHYWEFLKIPLSQYSTNWYNSMYIHSGSSEIWLTKYEIFLRTEIWNSRKQELIFQRIAALAYWVPSGPTLSM